MKNRLFNNSITNAVSTLASVVYILLFLICNFFLTNGDFSLENILISGLSLVISLYSFNKIGSKITASNVFLFFFYIGLALNGLNLSTLQKPKELIDIYFFFFGPLIFYLVLFVVEKIKFKKITITEKIIDGKYIAIVLFFLYVVLRMLVFKKTGIKLLDRNFSMQDNDAYSVGGITGLCSTLMLSSLMLMDGCGKLYRIIVISISILFECFFMVSRGQIIKIGTFIFIYLILSNINKIDKTENKKKNRKTLLIYFLLVIIVILIFVLFGELRQSMRSNGEYSIVKVTGLKINSVPLAWLYSYYPLNYEVLRLYYLNGIVQKGFPSTILMPVVRLIFNNPELYKSLMLSVTTVKLNGFNAATFLSNYISDLGFWYFIELSILALYIGLIEKISIVYKSIGLQSFVLMMVILYVFGDYSMVAFFVLAALLIAFMYIFIIKEKKDA